MLQKSLNCVSTILRIELKGLQKAHQNLANVSYYPGFHNPLSDQKRVQGKCFENIIPSQNHKNYKCDFLHNFHLEILDITTMCLATQMFAICLLNRL